MNKKIIHNNEEINYTVVYKNVKNINIRINPNGEVVVSCDKNVEPQTIKEQLRKKAKWILKTIAEYQENTIIFDNENKTFVNGSEIVLLGRNLRVQNRYSNEFSISHDNNYLYINRVDERGIKAKFDKWLSEFSINVFNELLEKYYNKYEKYGIAKPQIICRDMKTRWGTCNAHKGIITLNSQLIKVSPYIIEYVICHELNHLKHPLHNKEFYSFLTVVMPDWKEREKQLRKIFIKKSNI